MGCCKCSRKRCITSCFRFMQLCSHIILFFCPRKYEFLYSGVLSFFFLSVIVKAQFIIRHSFRPLFSPDILQNKMQKMVNQILIKSPSAFNTSPNFCGINSSRGSQKVSGLGVMTMKAWRKRQSRVVTWCIILLEVDICVTSQWSSVSTKGPQVCQECPHAIPAPSAWTTNSGRDGSTASPHLQLNSDPPIPAGCGRNWNSSDFSEFW